MMGSWVYDMYIIYIYGGFLSHGGTPIAGWFVSWKILFKWMIWGYPHFRKPPYEQHGIMDDDLMLTYHGYTHKCGFRFMVLYMSICAYYLITLK
jgi:hypothetical protein